MKMKEAMEIMEHGIAPDGFMVSFEHVRGKLLVGDYFPDVHAGEQPIRTEDEAWNLAINFAVVTFGKCVNVHVVRQDFTPTNGYMIIKNR